MEKRRMDTLLSGRFVFWAIVLCLVVGIAVALYKERYVPPVVDDHVNNTQTTTVRDIEQFPEYIQITPLEDGRRLVVNKKDGYQVEVEKGWYVYKDGFGKEFYLDIQDYEEPLEAAGGLPDCKVVIFVDDKVPADLNRQTETQCRDDIDCESFTFVEKNYSGKTWFERRFFGEFVGAGRPEYLSIHEGKLYRLFAGCSQQKSEYVENILKNFDF